MEDLNREIERQRQCSGCPLEGRVFVGMDTERNGRGVRRDILFLGLNPGIEEARLKRPFVGRSGSFLRSCLSKRGVNVWAMVNSILCSTGNQNAIPNEALCHRLCRANLARFVLRVMPKVIVPCGNGAASIFGLGSGISANCRRIFISRGRNGRAPATVVMPIKHPSAIIRNGGESASDYGEYLARLSEIGNIGQLVANGVSEDILERNGIRFSQLFRNEA